MTDANTLTIVITIVSFLQIILLAWIKYRQSECSIWCCKGSCTKIPEDEKKEIAETNFSLLKRV